MSDRTTKPPSMTELHAAAHLMPLEQGIYCVYPSVDAAAPDPLTGFPAVRLSLPPGQSARDVIISAVGNDGWLGASSAAALVNVVAPTGCILVTIYQEPSADRRPPDIQIMRVTSSVGLIGPDAAADQTAAMEAARRVAGPFDTGSRPSDAPVMRKIEVAAHVQGRGDQTAQIGEWVGLRGSQRWIEGFALAPGALVRSEDLEYQAVLGMDWISPWCGTGEFCGSRGMALPLLGLRVRLRGETAARYAVQLTATFIDKTSVGPVGDDEVCQAPGMVPLEAFLIELRALAPILPDEAASPETQPLAMLASEPFSPETRAAPQSRRGLQPIVLTSAYRGR